MLLVLGPLFSIADLSEIFLLLWAQALLGSPPGETGLCRSYSLFLSVPKVLPAPTCLLSLVCLLVLARHLLAQMMKVLIVVASCLAGILLIANPSLLMKAGRRPWNSFGEWLRRLTTDMWKAFPSIKRRWNLAFLKYTAAIIPLCLWALLSLSYLIILTCYCHFLYVFVHRLRYTAILAGNFLGKCGLMCEEAVRRIADLEGYIQ